MRKRSLSIVAGLMAVGLLTACGSSEESTSAESTAAETAAEESAAEEPAAEMGPIKIALIPPTSGPLAEFGSDARAAWEFAVEEVNAAGGINGTQVELIVKDTDGTPETTLRAAREAVEQDGATFIGAVMTSTEHGALAPQLPALGAIEINALGKDPALTAENCTPNHFRVVQNTAMDVRALEATIADLPGDKWAIQAVDNVNGRSSAEFFRAAAEAAGKEIVYEGFSPLGTTEYGTYITQIQDSGADALFTVEQGASAVAFTQQLDQFDALGQFQTVLGFNAYSEPLFPALGDTIEGFYNNVGYVNSDPNPLNVAFVEAWEAKNGEKPYYVIADNYLGAQTLFEAIKAAGSSDVEAVKTALRGLTFESFAGPVTMRGEDGQMIRPTYVGKLVKGADGNIGWEIVATVPGDQVIGEVSADCKL